jgi:hypothetical protein
MFVMIVDPKEYALFRSAADASVVLPEWPQHHLPGAVNGAPYNPRTAIVGAAAACLTPRP